MATPQNDPTNLRPEDSIRVAEIRNALIAEMRDAKDGKERKAAIEDVQDLKQDALQSIRHVMTHSQNESLKARVSMWTIDKILEAEKANDDPMAEFLKSLPPVAEETNTATNKEATP